MKTLDCSTLELLIENHEPLELIDIRSKKEFSTMHIPGARSLPFTELAKPKGFPRWRRTTEPVYVVSDDCVKASLAAGILRASGYVNSTVVDGGMKQWIAQGLPVLTKRFSFRLASFLKASSIVLGIVALIALGFMKILICALIAVSAVAVFAKAHFIERDQTRETPRLDWATA
jgi:rhodanese-related sulfurtransferase